MYVCMYVHMYVRSVGDVSARLSLSVSRAGLMSVAVPPVIDPAGSSSDSCLSVTPTCDRWHRSCQERQKSWARLGLPWA